ncbi:MAG: PhzF family phenazine biosynthesis protein [Steroidobacteraceae bacterium]
MNQYHYRLMNVFTRDGQPLSGNPLCVFEDGSGVDTATMQALARQFNLSETTFLLPSDKATAQVRIFAPGYEMVFAGHPTLGSAQACRSLRLGGDSLTLELKAGVIPVSAQGSRWTLAANQARWREVELPRKQLAQALGLSEQDLAERPLWVNTGKEQLVVPLASVAAVRRALPNVQALGATRSVEDQSMAYVFAEAAPGQVLCRYFFPQHSALIEDPATGSACANLGGWWFAMNRDLPCKLIISQGEQVNRPSTLYLDIDSSGRIRVGGDVIELGRGSISI